MAAIDSDTPRSGASGSEARVAGRRPWQGASLVLLALLVASIVGVGVSVAAFFVPGAVVSALLAAVFYVGLVAVRLGGRRPPGRAAAGGPETDSETGQDRAAALPESVVVVERTGLRLALIIGAPLSVLAVVLASVFLHWTVIGWAALAIFAAMLLMGAPVWLAAVEDEIEEAEDRRGIDHPPSIR